jgi:hypothetical protein
MIVRRPAAAGHVPTARGATSRRRGTRPHRWWCNVPLPRDTSPSPVVQRPAVAGHVPIARGATSRGRGTRPHRPWCNVPRLRDTYTQAARQYPASKNFADPLDRLCNVTYTYRHEVGVRKNKDLGGCRRYRCSGWDEKLVPLRELSLLLLPRDARGVHLGTITNRKCRRVAVPSSQWRARTCRRVLGCAAGLNRPLGVFWRLYDVHQKSGS